MGSIGPLVGEHLALDLLNTQVRLPSQERLDLLDTVAQLRHWIECEADRLPSPVTVGVGSLTRTDLDVVRTTRAHAASAIGQARLGAEPQPGALRGLNDAQRAAPMISELRWDGTAVTATGRREGPLGLRLAAYLAETAARLLADGKVTTIRQCEADYCVLLFLPANPRRRWCSARICGNRARVARHYERHKGAAPGTRTR